MCLAALDVQNNQYEPYRGFVHLQRHLQTTAKRAVNAETKHEARNPLAKKSLSPLRQEALNSVFFLPNDTAQKSVKTFILC